MYTDGIHVVIVVVLTVVKTAVTRPDNPNDQYHPRLRLDNQHDHESWLTLEIRTVNMIMNLR